MKYLEDCGRYQFTTVPDAKVAIFAGAGISAESGLSTFRDAGGIWSQYDMNRVCNLNSYHRYKEESLEFYNNVKTAINQVQPNAAHIAIAEFQKQFPDDVVIVTSNIDDLFEKAGCSNVLHIHGDCNHLSCTYCYHRFFIGENLFDIPDDLKCPSCGRFKKLKPGVVFFGEMAPAYEPFRNIFADSNLIHKIIIGSTLKVNDPSNFYFKYGKNNYYIDNNPSDHLKEHFSEIIKDSATNAVPILLNRIAKTL